VNEPRTQRTPRDLFAKEIFEQQPRLIQMAGEGTGRLFVLDQGETVVGSGSAANLLVRDGAVSRRHFAVTRDDTTIRIRDLGSTNGTFVDEVAIESAILRGDELIRAGKVVFKLELRYQPLRPPAEPKRSGFRGLVGNTELMSKVFAARDQLAGSDVTVLIQGETGTGKSALARSIHGASKRRASPFVVFDCGAVAPSLVESILFGHEQGAFTGAVKQRTGLLEAAADGTLFIDELGELPAELQPKLLRVLEEREFTRVGATKPLRVNCRVIAASQHDVWALVNEGKFRQDLYFRLAVFTVPLPPLRERMDDLALLVNQVFEDMQIFDRDFMSLPQEVRSEMLRHDWPGNIRELRNYLERHVAMPGAGAPVGPVKMPSVPATASDPPREQDSIDVERPYRDVKDEAVARLERAYFSALMQRCNGNVSEMARRSGINRRHIHVLIKKHGLH
jgi:DNA-binding NtrC family response regulator